MAQDWSSFTRFAVEIARDAGKLLLDYQGKLRNVKGKSVAHDLVTEADISAENLILERIREKYPHHGILSEETGSTRKPGSFRWVVDPLDGTTNYVHGYSVFAVSIALEYQGETISGVVYNPAENECFHATAGSGAFLNDKKIRPSRISTVKDGLFLSGFPYQQDERWHKSFEIFRKVYGASQGVRRLGAASLDLCYVAAGRFEGYWEFNLKPWDIRAGEFILREAGGVTSDWDGSPLPPSGARILGSNKGVHHELISLLTSTDYSLFKDGF